MKFWEWNACVREFDSKNGGLGLAEMGHAVQVMLEDRNRTSMEQKMALRCMGEALIAADVARKRLVRALKQKVEKKNGTTSPKV